VAHRLLTGGRAMKSFKEPRNVFRLEAFSNKSHMFCSANNISPDLFPVDTVVQLFIYKAHNGNIIASY
jgi:hypothetical protein